MILCTILIKVIYCATLFLLGYQIQEWWREKNAKRKKRRDKELAAKWAISGGKK